MPICCSISLNNSESHHNWISLIICMISIFIAVYCISHNKLFVKMIILDSAMLLLKACIINVYRIKYYMKCFMIYVISWLSRLSELAWVNSLSVFRWSWAKSACKGVNFLKIRGCLSIHAHFKFIRIKYNAGKITPKLTPLVILQPSHALDKFSRKGGGRKFFIQSLAIDAYRHWVLKSAMIYCVIPSTIYTCTLVILGCANYWSRGHFVQFCLRGNPRVLKRYSACTMVYMCNKSTQ